MTLYQSYYTYQDAVDHLLDLFGMTRDARNHRQCRRAVDTAYREIWNAHDWNYAYQRFSILTTASYSTGTVVYDHTGGSSERLLTFTGATLPSDFAYGTIKLNEVYYDIDQRLSATTATLRDTHNPGADVASTAYLWFRDCYPLPIGVRGISRIVDTSAVAREMFYVTPDELLARNRGYDTVGYPWYYTFTKDESYTGRTCIRFGPPPDSARNMDCFGVFGDGKPLLTETMTGGTVTTSGTSVTGSGTAFAAKHVGSVIRFGSASQLPTNQFGSVDTNADTPFVAERVIRKVTSATAATIDTALDSEVSAVKFSVSDNLDIEEATMRTAFLRLAEAEMSILLNQTQNTIDRRRQRANSAILAAMGADNRKRYTGEQPFFFPTDLGDLASSITLDP